MSHYHDQVMYDAGALHGLEVYGQEAQALKTFDAPTMLGHLSFAADGTPFGRGLLHGIALGARLKAQAQDAVVRSWRA